MYMWHACPGSYNKNLAMERGRGCKGGRRQREGWEGGRGDGEGGEGGREGGE